MTAAKEQPHSPEHCARAWHVLRLAHRLVEQQLEQALSAECRLSLHEFDALLVLHLASGNGCRMQDLVGPVPLSQPALSRLIARLVERGLVERTQEGADGRVTVVRLTTSGEQLTSDAISIHAQTIHNTLTGQLDARQQAALLDILGQVATESRNASRN